MVTLTGLWVLAIRMGMVRRAEGLVGLLGIPQTQEDRGQTLEECRAILEGLKQCLGLPKATLDTPIHQVKLVWDTLACSSRHSNPCKPCRLRGWGALGCTRSQVTLSLEDPCLDTIPTTSRELRKMGLKLRSQLPITGLGIQVVQILAAWQVLIQTLHHKTFPKAKVILVAR